MSLDAVATEILEGGDSLAGWNHICALLRSDPQDQVRAALAASRKQGKASTSVFAAFVNSKLGKLVVKTTAGLEEAAAKDDLTSSVIAVFLNIYDPSYPTIL